MSKPTIRVFYDENGDKLFCMADACKCAGIDPRRAQRILDNTRKVFRMDDSAGHGVQKLRFVTGDELDRIADLGERSFSANLIDIDTGDVNGKPAKSEETGKSKKASCSCKKAAGKKDACKCQECKKDKDCRKESDEQLGDAFSYYVSELCDALDNFLCALSRCL